MECHSDGTELVINNTISLLVGIIIVLFHLFLPEVVGAVVSVLIIWVIAGVLFYEAILRVIHPERFEVNADIMLITACIGVYVNVL